MSKETRKTVAIVDDETPIGSIFSEVIEVMGFSAIYFEKPHSILAAISDGEMERIDIILSDVAMPEMNGKELTRRIKKIFPASKVILMSGYTEEMVKLKKTDCDLFLEKPISLSILRAKIRELLS